MATTSRLSRIVNRPNQGIEIQRFRLQEHYSIVPGAGNDDQNIQNFFTTPDKSTIITTSKVSEECFNVSYSFVTH